MKNTHRFGSAMLGAFLLAGASLGAAETSFKLFNATPVTGSGPVTSPAQAVAFEEMAVTLNCPAEPQGVLSGTTDGLGGLAVDNFITVNEVNVCPGTGSPNCFTYFSGVIGQPADTAYGAVAPIDISSQLVSGRSLVTFELKDYGAVLGNTDIFLVTNCVVAERVEICHRPGTASQKTIEVAQSAVRGHLSHGDALGACPAS